MRRAYRPEEKASRRQSILVGALQLLRETAYPDLRMTDLAQRLGLGKGTLYLYFPTKESLFLAVLQAVLESLGRAARRLPTRAFWQGQGYWMDPAHGGLTTHGASPENVARELGEFGFQLRQVLGDDYPRTSGRFVTDWYYYVFSKTGANGEK